MLARDQGRAVFAAVAPRKPLPEIEEPPVDDTPMPTSLEEYGLSADAEREDMATPEPSIPGSTAKPKFVPIAIDDVTVPDKPAWLIGGLLPTHGLACLVGPPKSGKSFLASDMLCTVARGALYAGRETLQGPVIYLTGEGVSGFKRRLVAMRQHLGIEGQGVPFFMIENARTWQRGHRPAAAAR